MKDFKCKYCGHTSYIWQIVPFSIACGKHKYSFHVKEICGKCHKFQRFAKQTPEVIQAIKNSVLLENTHITKEIPLE